MTEILFTNLLYFLSCGEVPILHFDTGTSGQYAVDRKVLIKTRSCIFPRVEVELKNVYPGSSRKLQNALLLLSQTFLIAWRSHRRPAAQGSCCSLLLAHSASTRSTRDSGDVFKGLSATKLSEKAAWNQRL